MLNPEEIYYFSEQLQKEAGAGKWFATGLKDTGKYMGGFLRNPVKSVKGGWKGLSGTGKGAVADLEKEVLKANKGLAEKGLPGGYSGKDALMAEKGVSGKLRRGGWLANYGKYQGPDKGRQIRNTIARALPGQKAVQVPVLGYFANQDLKDPTGTQGKGERVGRAAGGLSMGLVTSRAGILPAILGMTGGAVLGGLAGRGVDKAVSTKPKKLPKAAMQGVAALPSAAGAAVSQEAQKRINRTTDIVPGSIKTAQVITESRLFRLLSE